jgi:hypothetical protein
VRAACGKTARAVRKGGRRERPLGLATSPDPTVVGVTSHQGGRESRPQGEGDGLLGYATCQPDDVRDEQGDFVNQRCWEEPSEHVRCSGEVV